MAKLKEVSALKSTGVEPLAQSETRIATRLAAIEAEIERTLSRIQDDAKGDPGPAGSAGRDGKDGKLPAVKSWVSGVVFYEGDCVFHGGSAWQATEDNANEPGASASWRCIAAGGRDAQPWRIRGTWRAVYASAPSIDNQ
jgi:hypothetical protein